jgi:hypothetical protein
LEKDPLVSDSDMLGPGYYVLALGVFLMITNVNYLIIHAKKRVNLSLESDGTKIVVLKMIAICAIYALLIGVIGYIVASIIFFFLAYRTSGVRPLYAAAILAFATSSVFYIIFIKYFSMSFPKGLFFL